MEDAKISGAKQAVQTMLFYYLTTLIGVYKDPKQYIASEMAEMIDLSEDQARFVSMHIGTNGKVMESLTSSISLLEGMEKTGQFDANSVHIVKGMLTALREEGQIALDRYIEKEEEDKQDGDIQ